MENIRCIIFSRKWFQRKLYIGLGWWQNYYRLTDKPQSPWLHTALFVRFDCTDPFRSEPTHLSLLLSILPLSLAIHLQPSTSSHFALVSPLCLLPSPPVVSPLSSMLYSLGLSLGAAHCVYVPGMADRPDPLTKRFFSPSSFTPSLATRRRLAVHLYASLSLCRVWYVCLFLSSVRLIFPLSVFSRMIGGWGRFLSHFHSRGVLQDATHVHTLLIPAICARDTLRHSNVQHLKTEDEDVRVGVIKTQISPKTGKIGRGGHQGVCACWYMATRVTHTHK